MIVVGDDVLTDIQGAKNADLVGYLVGTGKFKPAHLQEYQVDERQYLKNIKEIIHVLGFNYE